jgi:hypothetical protein
VHRPQLYAMKAGPACRPLVQLLLSKQVDPTSPIPLSAARSSTLAGLTPVHLLACCTKEAVLSACIRDADSNTPEMMERADTMCVEHFLALRDLMNADSPGDIYTGADFNARTWERGETPLALAAMVGANHFITLLASTRCLDLNMPRSLDAVRPLDLAVALGKTSTALLLIDSGAEVRASWRVAACDRLGRVVEPVLQSMVQCPPITYFFCAASILHKVFLCVRV